MKKNKKILLIICLIVIIIAVIAIFLIKNNIVDKSENNTETSDNSNEDTKSEQIVEEYVETRDNNVKVNVSDALNIQREFEGLNLIDPQLTYQDSQTKLLFTAINNTSIDTDLMEIEVTLYDDEENEIATLDGIIAPLEAGESTIINISSSLDYSNAYSLEINLK